MKICAQNGLKMEGMRVVRFQLLKKQRLRWNLLTEGSSKGGVIQFGKFSPRPLTDEGVLADGNLNPAPTLFSRDIQNPSWDSRRANQPFLFIPFDDLHGLVFFLLRKV